MGEKDFQQLYLLKKYLRKHSSKIIECRTIRERNKLALSSRNSLLQKREKNLAAKLITNIMKLKRKLNMRSNIQKALNKTGNEITPIIAVIKNAQIVKGSLKKVIPFVLKLSTVTI